MKLGRPTLLLKEKKTQIIGIRVRAEERRTLEIASERDKKRLSDWIRDKALAAAKKKVRNR